MFIIQLFFLQFLLFYVFFATIIMNKYKYIIQLIVSVYL